MHVRTCVQVATPLRGSNSCPSVASGSIVLSLMHCATKDSTNYWGQVLLFQWDMRKKFTSVWWIVQVNFSEWVSDLAAATNNPFITHARIHGLKNDSSYTGDIKPDRCLVSYRSSQIDFTTKSMSYKTKHFEHSEIFQHVRNYGNYASLIQSKQIPIKFCKQFKHTDPIMDHYFNSLICGVDWFNLFVEVFPVFTVNVKFISCSKIVQYHSFDWSNPAFLSFLHVFQLKIERRKNGDQLAGMVNLNIPKIWGSWVN